MSEGEKKKGLVLSGGGGRGAYHIGVLSFLEEQGWFPDVVAGTSIGAVNGAAIASGHKSKELKELWRELRTRDVQKMRLRLLPTLTELWQQLIARNGQKKERSVTPPFVWDTAPLQKTLIERGWIDFDKVNNRNGKQAAVDLRVTATEVETGKLRVFGNSPDPDNRGSEIEHEPLSWEHIIASCSIPLAYPATKLGPKLKKKFYWDGATVANTPLGAAIDAGAEDIVVVIMTPWAPDKNEVQNRPPNNLITAASATLEWALLASFQADLDTLKRVNKLIELQEEIGRLLKDNYALRSQLRDEGLLADDDHDGTPDILQKKFLEHPLVVSPLEPIPVKQIITYEKEGHERLFKQGYEDARRAWRTVREKGE